MTIKTKFEVDDRVWIKLIYKENIHLVEAKITEIMVDVTRNPEGTDLAPLTSVSYELVLSSNLNKHSDAKITRAKVEEALFKTYEELEESLRDSRIGWKEPITLMEALREDSSRPLKASEQGSFYE